MGTLKPILFSGELTGDRLNASTLSPLEMAGELVTAAFAGHTADTAQTQAGHTADTRPRHSETQQSQQPQGLQAIPTACVPNHGKTVIRRYGYTGDLSALHTQHAASPVDEWLDEYDSTQSLSASESASAGGQDGPMQLDSVPAWDDNDEEEL